MKRLLSGVVLSLLVACSTPEPQPQLKTFKSQLAQTQDVGFVLHPEIIKDLGALKIEVKSLNLLSNMSSKDLGQTIEFRSFQRKDHLCVRFIGRVYSNSPVVDFWVHVVYGHTGTDVVTFPREALSVAIRNGEQLSSVVLDAPEQDDLIGHGQGLALRHFRYSFKEDKQLEDKQIQDVTVKTIAPWFTPCETSHWLKPENAYDDLVKLRSGDDVDYPALDKSRFVPAFPGKTGGQAQFGVYGVLPEMKAGKILTYIWRKQLYQEGARVGHFLSPDGKRINDSDPRYNQLILGAGPHSHSRGYRDQAWFKPQGWDWMGKTPDGTKWRVWDDQHWSITLMCQVYILTQDPGLELLLGDLAETLMFNNPAINKGTTHNIPGAARARGRVVESASALYYALPNPDVKQRLKQRINDLVRLQLAAWEADGLVTRPDGISIWEHGLWVKGLAAAYGILETDNDRIRTYVAAMGIAKFVLGGFKDWNGSWGIPYTISPDRKTWSSSPSYGLSDWCIPSLQLLDVFGRGLLSADEKVKLTGILKQYVTERKPAPSGAYDDSFRWRIF